MSLIICLSGSQISERLVGILAEFALDIRFLQTYYNFGI